MGATTLLNFFFYTYLKTTGSSSLPHIAICIPARNEATVIHANLTALLNQTYPHYTIYLLDDNSADATRQIATILAEKHPRLTVIDGRPLPQGWLGKNWACHQLANVALGDTLIFTDADVIWKPTALAALIHEFEQTQADTLSVWPTQITHTWGERLVVPLISMSILAYLPLIGVYFTKSAAFAAANGQCIAFKRTVYDAIGGHAAVRDNIIEDVALARATKASGFRLRLTDGNRLIRTRMYEDWATTRDGLSKNLFAGHGYSTLFLLVSTLFHWVLFVLPMIWFFISLGRGGTLLPPLLLYLAGVFVRGISAKLTNQRFGDAFLMPISVLLMTRIAWRSAHWHRTGTASWKGRAISD